MHLQPDGRPATIKWVTVGGRTSAYIVELQQVSRGSAAEAIKSVRMNFFRRAEKPC